MQTLEDSKDWERPGVLFDKAQNVEKALLNQIDGNGIDSGRLAK